MVARINILLVSVICGVFALALAVGIAIGYYALKPQLNSQEDTGREMRLNSSRYIFINPLLDKIEHTSNPLLSREVADLKSEVEDLTNDAIAKKTIKSGSVYYRDLNNGPWFSTYDEDQFKPASLMKLPVMIAFYKLAEVQPEILEKIVTYEKPFKNVVQHHVEGSDVTIELGKSYTINELLERMIIYSDNLSAYLLLENIDAKFVTQVFDDLAVPDLEEINDFGPRTYASYLRILYNATYINETYSEKALEILSRSTFSHGMRSVLNPGVKASIKYGIASEPYNNNQLHECGIIYWQTNRPHVLCIMTIGDEYTQMATFIKDVTTAVQTAVTKEE